MEIISRAHVHKPTVGQIHPTRYVRVTPELRTFSTFVKECKKQTKIANNKKLNRQEKEKEREEVKEEGEEKTGEDGEEDKEMLRDRIWPPTLTI